jgi:hypothetical protein
MQGVRSQEKAEAGIDKKPEERIREARSAEPNVGRPFKAGIVAPRDSSRSHSPTRPLPSFRPSIVHGVHPLLSAPLICAYLGWARNFVTTLPDSALRIVIHPSKPPIASRFSSGETMHAALGEAGRSKVASTLLLSAA